MGRLSSYGNERISGNRIRSERSETCEAGLASFERMNPKALFMYIKTVENDAVVEKNNMGTLKKIRKIG